MEKYAFNGDKCYLSVEKQGTETRFMAGNDNLQWDIAARPRQMYLVNGQVYLGFMNNASRVMIEGVTSLQFAEFSQAVREISGMRMVCYGCRTVYSECM